MDNTKIDWADMSWNPVTGCRHGCTYCYARRVAERFGGAQYYDKGENGEWREWFVTPTDEYIHVLEEPVKRGSAEKPVNAPYPYYFEPTLHRYRLGDPARKARSRNIFVCSMADLFGRWVPTSWILEVLDACLAAPQHNYMFLTKNPQRYIELDEMALLPRESNFWYGTTATREGEQIFFSSFHNTFVSVEPMMGPVFPSENGLLVDWVIVGAETGPKVATVPERAWVEDLAEACRAEEVPLFMKGNLAGVWGEELIQQLPDGLRRE